MFGHWKRNAIMGYWSCVACSLLAALTGHDGYAFVAGMLVIHALQPDGGE